MYTVLYGLLFIVFILATYCCIVPLYFSLCLVVIHCVSSITRARSALPTQVKLLHVRKACCGGVKK